MRIATWHDLSELGLSGRRGLNRHIRECKIDFWRDPFKKRECINNVWGTKVIFQ